LSVDSLDGPAISGIAEAKQRSNEKERSSDSDQNLLCRAPPCLRHVKPLVPAAFAVVSTHQSALGPRGGLWLVLVVGDP
jgi:hypothetical protein